MTDSSDKRYLEHSPKTVAVLGMGPSCIDYITDTCTQEFEPGFADEVWAVNMASNTFHHDVVFWMDDLEDQENFKPGLFSCLRRRGKPVITSKRYEDIVPNSYDFPIEEVSKIGMPMFGHPYLANGIAQLIGYAIWKGVKLLKLYGADFTYPNRNYAEAGRACTEAWIVLADKYGMQVKLAPSSSLFDYVGGPGFYGFKDFPTIDLPDGKTFSYKPRDIQGHVHYHPENSSGVPDESSTDQHVSTGIPGTEGPSADGGGENPGTGEPADAIAAGAIGGSRESIRNHDSDGRPEGRDFDDPGDQGAGGLVPAIGKKPIPSGKGKPKRRRAANRAAAAA